MTAVGELERRTQERGVNHFRHQLGYRYLGDWHERAGNKNIETDLRYGARVSPGLGEHTVTVDLIDRDNPAANDFAIAEEVTVEGHHTKRPDIVDFIRPFFQRVPEYAIGLRGLPSDSWSSLPAAAPTQLDQPTRERFFSSHMGKHLAQSRFHLTSQICSPGRQAVRTRSMNSSLVPHSNSASVTLSMPSLPVSSSTASDTCPAVASPNLRAISRLRTIAWPCSRQF